MTISTPTYYDWPASIIPVRQLFYAGGQMVQGGFTSSGARVGYPEPGGRAFLEMDFGYQKHSRTDSLISWVMSKIANGNLFRVPLSATPQLISSADLGLSGSETGPLWAAEGILPERTWDNGQTWAYEVGAVAASIALEGSKEVSIDFADLPLSLRPGHVFGIADAAYLVDDLEWDDAVATIRVDPPLRADVSAGSFITFRPKMIVSAVNPESLRGLYQPADLVQLGSVQFMEALL